MADANIHGVTVGSGFLLFAAVGAGLLGLLFSSQASLGASLTGFGCILAIWARIAQASAHHYDQMGRK